MPAVGKSRFLLSPWREENWTDFSSAIYKLLGRAARILKLLYALTSALKLIHLCAIVKFIFLIGKSLSIKLYLAWKSLLNCI